MVWWKWNVVSRVYELRKKIETFKTNKETKDLLDQFCEIWNTFCLLGRLCLATKYIEPTFYCNSQDIWSCTEWATYLKKNVLYLIQCINRQGAGNKRKIQKNIILHLRNLQRELGCNFPECQNTSIQKLARNPFIISDRIQNEVIEINIKRLKRYIQIRK